MSDLLHPKIQELAHKLLCEEILDWTEYNDNYFNFTAVDDALQQYGYAVQKIAYLSKEYLFAFRDFSLPRNKPLPFEPQLELRKKAQEYEQTRQKMGYVTEQELALATECISTGNLVANSNMQGWILRYLKTRYGLLWLGYEEQWTCELFGGTTPIRKSEIPWEQRLKNLRSLRTQIVGQEEYSRLRSVLLRDSPKSCRYLKDFVAKQAAESQHRQLNSKIAQDSSFFQKISHFFTGASKLDGEGKPLKKQS